MIARRPRHTAAALTCLLLICGTFGCVRDEIVRQPAAPPPATGEVATSENDSGGEARSGDSGEQTTAASNKTPSTVDGNFRPLAGKVKFKRDDGSTAFSYKPADDGAKLVDGDEKELARFNVKEARLKVKRPDDSEAGNIRISTDRLKIENPAGDKLFELQRQADGDWKLDNAEEQLVYRLKLRDYGIEIEDADDNSLFKVKLKDGKLSVRDPSENTVLSTKDKFPTLAAAAMMLEKIEDEALRHGVAVVIALEIGGVKP